MIKLTKYYQLLILTAFVDMRMKNKEEIQQILICLLHLKDYISKFGVEIINGHGFLISYHNEKDQKTIMVLSNYREIQIGYFIIIRIWLLLLAGQLARESSLCLGLKNIDMPLDGFEENVTVESNTIDGYPRISDINVRDEPLSVGNSCHYFTNSKRLICTGALDYDYLKTVKGEEITDFIIQNYEAESLYKKQDWSLRNLETGEWYLNLPKQYQVLTGEVQLKDTGLQINVNLRMLPRKDTKGFLVDGEVFSNKILKISWRLKGELSLDFIRNRTVITLDVGDSNWRLQSNLTFSGKTLTDETDGWKASGIIKSDNVTSQLVIFKGNVWTEILNEECKFTGEVKLQKINLEAYLLGNVSPPQKKQITIPKSAFSDMKIQNILFKDSNFYNDFDRNSFAGIRGLKRIAFIESKLESLPRLDELFQSLMDLEEVYFEDCTASRLRFGSISNLKNIQKVSFRGSGPLSFDDTSFLWLKNSNLTSLNLRNSHVKISVKTDSVLWSVSHSLEKLDISHSTLNEEKDLNLILKNLKVSSLMAEGLKLKKIPTTALANVRKTLRYLTLKENDFRKNFEKNIFNNVLKFPYMPNLTELNLEDCHINYIERGTFDNLPNLKALYLSYNNIENLQDGWALITPKITTLILNHNGLIPRVLYIDLFDSGTSLNLRKFENLEILDLSNGVFSSINKVVASLGSNLKNLSLENTRLEDIPENFFENLTGLEILDLSNNKNIQPAQLFSLNILKKLASIKALNLARCRITGIYIDNNDLIKSKSFDNFTLENLSYLDLSLNNIKILESKIFKAFPNLKILNLSKNSITEWKKAMGFNDNLDSIFLNENKIETVTSEMISEIKKLKHVKLGNNPFVCGNYVYKIIEIINSTSTIQTDHVLHFKGSSVIDMQDIDFVKDIFYMGKNNLEVNSRNVKILDWSEKNYVCFSWSLSKFIPFTEVNENFQDTFRKKPDLTKAGLLWLVIVIVIGVVISVAIICWKFLDIHLITRAVRNAVAMTFIGRNEKVPANFKYSVFLSYTDKDRPWVVENLLPRLESVNDVKVCLHERDFQVGLSIIENILNSIESSRNIILVISQAFLKSQWCQYEMQLAQFRLIEKGRDQLILIFLENIPAIKRPKTLKYLMMTKTYLEWPVNSTSEKDIDNFWNKLMKSLVLNAA